MNESHGPISPEVRLIVRLYEAGWITSTDASNLADLAAALMVEAA